MQPAWLLRPGTMRYTGAVKILYGVVGEGMGHAMRSKVILDHLVSCGHQVTVMASGRASSFLSQHFPRVNNIHGFHIIAEENRVRRGKTFWSNVLAGVNGLPKNIAAYFELIEQFEPDIVISDFESWTYYFAKAHDLPILSIDNMQVINRCEHAPEIWEGERVEFDIVRTFVKSKLPFCDHYLITSFFRPPLRKPRTTLYPPILRSEILSTTATRGDHLLVYQTNERFTGLTKILNDTGLECRIYGMRRGIEEDVVEGNLRYRPFSERGFIDDLASARAVIANAGFTLMGEAVYFHKPMMAIPLENQFEQLLNARYLQREGYGVSAESVEAVAGVDTFLANLGRYEDNLARYHQDGNRVLLADLEQHLRTARLD